METTSSPTSPEPSPWSRSNRALAIWGGVATALILLAFSSTALDDEERDTSDVLFEYEFAVGSLIVYAVIVGVTWIAARGFGDARDGLGLRSFAPRWVWIVLGLTVLSLIVSTLLEPILHAGEEQGLAPDEWQEDRVPAFVAERARGLARRALRRGALLPRPRRPCARFLGKSAAIVGTALAFALAHGLLVGIPALGFFGLVLAWVRWRASSVWPGFIAHALYNAIGIVARRIVAINEEDELRPTRAFSSRCGRHNNASVRRAIFAALVTLALPVAADAATVNLAVSPGSSAIRARSRSPGRSSPPSRACPSGSTAVGLLVEPRRLEARRPATGPFASRRPATAGSVHGDRAGRPRTQASSSGVALRIRPGLTARVRGARGSARGSSRRPAPSVSRGAGHARIAGTTRRLRVRPAAASARPPERGPGHGTGASCSRPPPDTSASRAATSSSALPSLRRGSAGNAVRALEASASTTSTTPSAPSTRTTAATRTRR